MALELSPEQQKVLTDTQPAQTPAEFEALRDAANADMNRVVVEIMGPSQAIQTTLTELRDLYLSVLTFGAKLEPTGYGAERQARLRDAIRLLETAFLWFGEGARTGAFRVRPVADVIEASRPWRARLAAYAGQAFVFLPDKADLFADVNSSGTMDEEIADLRMLLQNASSDEAALAAVGMKPEFIKQGESLLREAQGRDLLGVLGLRNQEDAILLRNRILTYGVQLGREARAAGINGCWDEPSARRRFEAASFRDALRRLRPKRRGSKADEPAEETTAEDASTEKKPA